ncbi:MAG: epimerase [Flavobacteriales bacterium]|nr:epimerase [Flavobacteriales bacterium]
MIKAIITGTTGMLGMGVLLECLENNDVSEVLIFNRTSIGMNHPELKEVLTKDFYDLSSIAKELEGYNTCYFGLGTTSVGKDEPEYHKITYDLTTTFAKAVLKNNTDVTFCYVSGVGTDSSEKGKSMWARVKGKTENALIAMPFKGSFAFRPGYIQPLKGAKAKSGSVNFFYALFKPLYPLLKRMPSIITDTTSIGKAMISLSKNGYDKNVIDVIDINKLAN